MVLEYVRQRQEHKQESPDRPDNSSTPRTQA